MGSNHRALEARCPFPGAITLPFPGPDSSLECRSGRHSFAENNGGATEFAVLLLLLLLFSLLMLLLLWLLDLSGSRTRCCLVQPYCLFAIGFRHRLIQLYTATGEAFRQRGERLYATFSALSAHLLCTCSALCAHFFPALCAHHGCVTSVRTSEK